MPRLRTALSVLALAVAPAAQTFIVDAAGGAGSSFSDLPPAIAAVPDGAVLLVRPGTYSGFEIVAKGLSVLGDPGVVIAPTLGPNLRIADTTAMQPVIVRGLEYAGSGILRLDACAGPVLLEDLTAAAGGLSLYAGPCNDLMVRNCGPFQGFGPAISVFDSTTTLVGCDCTPTALGGCLYAGAGRTYVVDCVIQGGSGGTFGVANPALQMLDTVALMGTTQVIGTTGPFGTALSVGGFGTLLIDTGASFPFGLAPTITVANEPQAYVAATGGTIGSTADVSLTVPAGAFGALLLGRIESHIDVPGFGGPLWLDPATVIFAATGVGSATTTLTVPNTSTLQGSAFGWQGLGFAQPHGFFFGNVVPFAP